jgi:RNA polymerase sigma-70 factor, ECF subfamily
MSSSSPGEVTQLLQAWTYGDSTALDKLIPLIEDKLRELARALLRYKYPHQDLQTTDVINETLLRLFQGPQTEWQSRTQFFAVAARAMRSILVDHSRARLARKRGAGAEHTRLEDAEHLPSASSEDLQTEQALEVLALDEALKRLASVDSRKSTIVDLKYFSGFTIEEIAEVLWMSPRLVERELRFARAWLKRELSEEEPGQRDISTTPQLTEPRISSIIIDDKELVEAWSNRELVATLMSENWRGLKLLVRLKSNMNVTRSQLVSDIEVKDEAAHSTFLKLEEHGAVDKRGDVFIITKRGLFLFENLEKAIGNSFD